MLIEGVGHAEHGLRLYFASANVFAMKRVTFLGKPCWRLMIAAIAARILS